MATFDEVTSRAKEIIDAVSKKTGEFVSVQKLRVEIADMKSKLNKLYRELGEIVYSASIEDIDCTETVEELITSIGMKKNAIDLLQAQIDAKQNKRVCPSCGKANTADAGFCSGCGIKLTYSYSDEDFSEASTVTAEETAE